LTGVTTLTASSTATIGAATSPLLIGRLADFTSYGAISFNGSLTSTTMNGLFGRLNATDGGLYICAPSGSATLLQVAGSTVATFAGALTTLATPLAINGAFTGATTGAFSGNITVGSTISLGAAGTASGLAYFLYQTDANSRSWCLRNDQTTYGDFEIQQATTRGGGTYAYALRFDASRNATFAGTLAINGAFTGATTGAFSSTLAVTGLATLSGGVSMDDGDTIQWASSSNRVFFNGGAFRVDVNGTQYLGISTAGLVTMPGTLAVTGAATFSSTVQIGTVSTLAQYGNSIYASRNFEWNLTYSAAVANNKDIGFSYVDNTHLRVYMKGSDGVTRSVDLTLA